MSNVVLADLAQASVWADRHVQVASLPSSLLPSPTSLPKPISSIPAPSSDSSRLPSIPHDVVRVRNMHVASKENHSSDVIYILQDIHQNQEAQLNMKTAIEKMNPDVVALEGAYGEMDFSSLRKIPHWPTTQGVVQTLMDQGRLSGPVVAGLNPGVSSKFVGVDDPVLYQKNVESYRQSLPNKEKVKTEISSAIRLVNQKKKKVFNAELLKVDQWREAYRQGQLTLGDYVKNLSTKSHDLHPDLLIFLEAVTMEKNINPTRVEKDRKHILRQLTNRLSESQLSTLLSMSLSYRAKKITFGDYYRFLSGEITKAGLSLSAYPAFDAYVQYILLSENVSYEKLQAALTNLEEDVFARAIQKAQEQILHEKGESLFLASRLIRFEMTPEEWKKYKTTARLEYSLETFEQFYRIAEERNAAIVKNLLNNAHGRSVLVVGGFHTPGLTALLREKEKNFVVLTPKITKVEGKGSAYLSVFSQEATPIEKLFKGEQLFVAPAMALSPNQVIDARQAPRMAAAWLFFFGALLLIHNLHGQFGAFALVVHAAVQAGLLAAGPSMLSYVRGGDIELQLKGKTGAQVRVQFVGEEIVLTPIQKRRFFRTLTWTTALTEFRDYIVQAAGAFLITSILFGFSAQSLTLALSISLVISVLRHTQKGIIQITKNGLALAISEYESISDRIRTGATQLILHLVMFGPLVISIFTAQPVLLIAMALAWGILFHVLYQEWVLLHGGLLATLNLESIFRHLKAEELQMRRGAPLDLTYIWREHFAKRRLVLEGLPTLRLPTDDEIDYDAVMQFREKMRGTKKKFFEPRLLEWAVLNTLEIFTPESRQRYPDVEEWMEAKIQRLEMFQSIVEQRPGSGYDELLKYLFLGDHTFVVFFDDELKLRNAPGLAAPQPDLFIINVYRPVGDKPHITLVPVDVKHSPGVSKPAQIRWDEPREGKNLNLRDVLNLGLFQADPGYRMSEARRRALSIYIESIIRWEMGLQPQVYANDPDIVDMEDGFFITYAPKGKWPKGNSKQDYILIRRDVKAILYELALLGPLMNMGLLFEKDEEEIASWIEDGADVLFEKQIRPMIEIGSLVYSITNAVPQKRFQLHFNRNDINRAIADLVWILTENDFEDVWDPRHPAAKEILIRSLIWIYQHGEQLTVETLSAALTRDHREGARALERYEKNNEQVQKKDQRADKKKKKRTRRSKNESIQSWMNNKRALHWLESGTTLSVATLLFFVLVHFNFHAVGAAAIALQGSLGVFVFVFHLNGAYQTSGRSAPQFRTYQSIRDQLKNYLWIFTLGLVLHSPLYAVLFLSPYSYWAYPIAFILSVWVHRKFVQLAIQKKWDIILPTGDGSSSIKRIQSWIPLVRAMIEGSFVYFLGIYFGWSIQGFFIALFSIIFAYLLFGWTIKTKVLVSSMAKTSTSLAVFVPLLFPSVFGPTSTIFLLLLAILPNWLAHATPFSRSETDPAFSVWTSLPFRKGELHQIPKMDLRHVIFYPATLLTPKILKQHGDWEIDPNLMSTFPMAISELGQNAMGPIRDKLSDKSDMDRIFQEMNLYVGEVVKDGKKYLMYTMENNGEIDLDEFKSKLPKVEEFLTDIISNLENVQPHEHIYINSYDIKGSEIDDYRRARDQVQDALRRDSIDLDLFKKLITLHGFTTKLQAGDIGGRGVGMDNLLKLNEFFGVVADIRIGKGKTRVSLAIPEDMYKRRDVENLSKKRMLLLVSITVALLIFYVTYGLFIRSLFQQAIILTPILILVVAILLEGVNGIIGVSSQEMWTKAFQGKGLRDINFGLVKRRAMLVFFFAPYGLVFAVSWLMPVFIRGMLGIPFFLAPFIQQLFINPILVHPTNYHLWKYWVNQMEEDDVIEEMREKLWDLAFAAFWHWTFAHIVAQFLIINNYSIIAFILLGVMGFLWSIISATILNNNQKVRPQGGVALVIRRVREGLGLMDTWLLWGMTGRVFTLYHSIVKKLHASAAFRFYVRLSLYYVFGAAASRLVFLLSASFLLGFSWPFVVLLTLTLLMAQALRDFFPMWRYDSKHKRDLRKLESQLSHLVWKRVISAETARETYHAVKDGKLKLKNELQYVVRVNNGNEIERMGLIDRAIGSKLKLLTMSSLAFVRTPDGDLLVGQRPRHKSGPFKYTIFGGSSFAGETPEDTIRRELVEELGFPPGWQLEGELVSMSHPDGPASASLISNKNNFHSLFVYSMSEREWAFIEKVKKVREEKRKKLGDEAFEAWLKNLHMKKNPIGEVRRYQTITIDSLRGHAQETRNVDDVNGPVILTKGLVKRLQSNDWILEFLESMGPPSTTKEWRQKDETVWTRSVIKPLIELVIFPGLALALAPFLGIHVAALGVAFYFVRFHELREKETRGPPKSWVDVSWIRIPVRLLFTALVIYASYYLPFLFTSSPFIQIVSGLLIGLISHALWNLVMPRSWHLSFPYHSPFKFDFQGNLQAFGNKIQSKPDRLTKDDIDDLMGTFHVMEPHFLRQQFVALNMAFDARPDVFVPEHLVKLVQLQTTFDYNQAFPVDVPFVTFPLRNLVQKVSEREEIIRALSPRDIERLSVSLQSRSSNSRNTTLKIYFRKAADTPNGKNFTAETLLNLGRMVQRYPIETMETYGTNIFKFFRLAVKDVPLTQQQRVETSVHFLNARNAIFSETKKPAAQRFKDIIDRVALFLHTREFMAGLANFALLVATNTENNYGRQIDEFVRRSDNFIAAFHSASQVYTLMHQADKNVQYYLILAYLINLGMSSKQAEWMLKTLYFFSKERKSSRLVMDGFRSLLTEAKTPIVTDQVLTMFRMREEDFSRLVSDSDDLPGVSFFNGLAEMDWSEEDVQRLMAFIWVFPMAIESFRQKREVNLSEPIPLYQMGLDWLVGEGSSIHGLIQPHGYRLAVRPNGNARFETIHPDLGYFFSWINLKNSFFTLLASGFVAFSSMGWGLPVFWTTMIQFLPIYFGSIFLFVVAIQFFGRFYRGSATLPTSITFTGDRLAKPHSESRFIRYNHKDKIFELNPFLYYLLASRWRFLFRPLLHVLLIFSHESVHASKYQLKIRGKKNWVGTLINEISAVILGQAFPLISGLAMTYFSGSFVLGFILMVLVGLRMSWNSQKLNIERPFIAALALVLITVVAGLAGFDIALMLAAPHYGLTEELWFISAAIFGFVLWFLLRPVLVGLMNISFSWVDTWFEKDRIRNSGRVAIFFQILLIWVFLSIFVPFTSVYSRLDADLHRVFFGKEPTNSIVLREGVRINGSYVHVRFAPGYTPAERATATREILFVLQNMSPQLAPSQLNGLVINMRPIRSVGNHGRMIYIPIGGRSYVVVDPNKGALRHEVGHVVWENLVPDPLKESWTERWNNNHEASDDNNAEETFVIFWDIYNQNVSTIVNEIETGDLKRDELLDFLVFMTEDPQGNPLYDRTDYTGPVRIPYFKRGRRAGFIEAKLVEGRFENPDQVYDDILEQASGIPPAVNRLVNGILVDFEKKTPKHVQVRQSGVIVDGNQLRRVTDALLVGIQKHPNYKDYVIVIHGPMINPIQNPNVEPTIVVTIDGIPVHVGIEQKNIEEKIALTFERVDVVGSRNGQFRQFIEIRRRADIYHSLIKSIPHTSAGQFQLSWDVRHLMELISERVHELQVKAIEGKISKDDIKFINEALAPLRPLLQWPGRDYQPSQPEIKKIHPPIQKMLKTLREKAIEEDKKALPPDPPQAPGEARLDPDPDDFDGILEKVLGRVRTRELAQVGFRRDSFVSVHDELSDELQVGMPEGRVLSLLLAGAEYDGEPTDVSPSQLHHFTVLRPSDRRHVLTHVRRLAKENNPNSWAVISVRTHDEKATLERLLFGVRSSLNVVIHVTHDDDFVENRLSLPSTLARSATFLKDDGESVTDFYRRVKITHYAQDISRLTWEIAQDLDPNLAQIIRKAAQIRLILRHLTLPVQAGHLGKTLPQLWRAILQSA